MRIKSALAGEIEKHHRREEIGRSLAARTKSVPALRSYLAEGRNLQIAGFPRG